MKALGGVDRLNALDASARNLILRPLTLIEPRVAMTAPLEASMTDEMVDALGVE